MTRRACACGRPLPKGRSRHCSDDCSRQASKQAERTRAAATVPVGTIRKGRQYQPAHPIAPASGWVALHRLRAYEQRGGIGSCDATSQIHPWPALNVVDAGEARMVLCQAHTRVRSFGQWLADSRFGGTLGEDLQRALAPLWSTACPAAGGASDFRGSEGQEETPLRGVSPGSHSPVNQGRL